MIVRHSTINKTMVFLAVMLMVFCIGGWLTGLATLGDDAMRNDPKIDTRVVDAFEDNEDKVEVIVILKSPNSGETIRSVQSEVLSSTSEFELGHKYSSVNAVSGKLDKYTLNEIRFNQYVEKIYYNEILSISLDDSVSLIKGDYVQSIRFKNNSLKGKGQSVCILDTGVDYNHSALSGRVVQGPDYYNNDLDPTDDNSHGTHVAGIVASNDSTYTGVAPEANIVAVKVCDSAGNCPSNNVTAGIDWCINHSSEYNISVISMSLGDDGGHNASECSNTTITPFVNNAVSNGIFVVASSGNGFHNNGISYPACISNVTSVNSVNKQDSIWDQGNTGESLDLLAPGVSIVSTVLGDNFGSKTGTSMAAPHVAGAAALIYQHANISGQSTTPYQVKSKLVNNGVNITDSDNNLTFPRVDIKEAILSCRLVLGGNSYPYPRSNAEVELYANYTNRTDGSAISGGNCSIFFNDESGNMTYNATKEIHQYFRNFTSPGIYSYNVSCNQSDFENVTETATIEILQGSENCTYQGSNEVWNITSENNSICIGENLILNQSNISIEPGAEFVLNYTNLTLVGASTRYAINVSSNAKFRLNNALVKGMDQGTRRLDVDIYGNANIINSTFENSRARFLGQSKNKIENVTFKYYSYFNVNSENNISDSVFESYSFFQDDSENNVSGCSFEDRFYTYGNSSAKISNSSLSGLVFMFDESNLNFTSPTSNITGQIRTYDSPTIYGEVDMPSTGQVVTGNATRFYPIQVYYNDGTTPYPNKAVTIKDSDGNILFEGETDNNGLIEINLTLNTTNYAIGNFSVSVNPTEDVGLLTDTPVIMQSSDSPPNGDDNGNGGGSGGGDDECIENWTCSNWSECTSSGYQTRTCSDAEACGTYENKPDEIQECELNSSNSNNKNTGGRDMDDLLQIHKVGSNALNGNGKDCCLWMICGARWKGLCWYHWVLIGGIAVLIFAIVYTKKRKERIKMQRAMMHALGVDWTIEHLHLKDIGRKKKKRKK